MTTPPPGPELDARVLAAIGWRWAQSLDRTLYALIPPAGDPVWQPSPDGPGVWAPAPAGFWPAESERYADWQRTCSRGEGSRWEVRMPHPSTDPAAAAELKRHLWATGRFSLIETRLYVAHDDIEHCASVTIHRKGWRHDHGHYHGIVPCGDDPIRAECHALCLAALEALTSAPAPATTLPRQPPA